MDGRLRLYDEMMGSSDQIKKGPWKAEEDEVLINHVKKYGPRDWSSIRSKGLLHRTGKSCRLRWVNKLRPNLKNGVKFSAEEERAVIDLQAQFGNKWAKIATYLPGRTDNDVKNFWSSRQKRLARILQTPSSSSSSNKSQKSSKHVLTIHDVPCLEGPKFSTSTEEEWLSKSQSCSSSYIDNSERFKMVPLPDLMNAKPLYYEPNLFQPEFISIEKKPCLGIDQSLTQLPFPQIPLQTDFTVNFDMVTGFGDPNSLAGFGHANSSELGQMQQFPIMPTCFGTERSSGIVVKKGNDNPLTPDSFMDEFPIDMFDHIDSLPSPSGW